MMCAADVELVCVSPDPWSSSSYLVSLHILLPGNTLPLMDCIDFPVYFVPFTYVSSSNPVSILPSSAYLCILCITSGFCFNHHLYSPLSSSRFIFKSWYASKFIFLDIYFHNCPYYFLDIMSIQKFNIVLDNTEISDINTQWFFHLSFLIIRSISAGSITFWPLYMNSSRYATSFLLNETQNPWSLLPFFTLLPPQHNLQKFINLYQHT